MGYKRTTPPEILKYGTYRVVATAEGGDKSAFDVKTPGGWPIMYDEPDPPYPPKAPLAKGYSAQIPDSGDDWLP